MGDFIYENNYKKLLILIPELWSLEAGQALKSKSEGYMDLNLDVLTVNDEHIVIALSHYYKHQSGGMIADPGMEIRVYRNGFRRGTDIPRYVQLSACLYREQ